jgi:hypothetical protein
METDKHESAKWALITNQAVDGYLETRDLVLDESAARGFPTVTGEGLSQLLVAGTKTKKTLTEANGKLYEEERTRIFEKIEFDLKLGVQVAKLAMQLYREQLLNEVGIEQTEEEARKERQRADIERLNAETERRQAAVIQAKADAEHEVNGFKMLLIDAERGTLSYERILLNAQLDTARVRLGIIDSIYQVIAAQALVVQAEKRKAAALALVIEADKRIAAVKEETIPYYLQKAAAREGLAVAVTEDAQVQKDIAALGFEKNLLKRTEQDEEHQMREQELDYELLTESLVRATLAEELAKAQSRRLLQEYANQTKATVLEARKLLEKEGIDLKFTTQLGRHKIETSAEIELATHQKGLVAQDLAAQLTNISQVGIDKAGTVSASAVQLYRTDTNALHSRRIYKGAF